MKSLSLRVRFILATGGWMLVGLVAVGVATALLFRQHVEGQYHSELEVHLVELSELSLLDANGVPQLYRPLSDPRYAVPGSGFYWQIERDGYPVRRSPSIVSGGLDSELAHQSDIVHRVAPGPTGPAMTYGFIRPAPDGVGEIHYLIAIDRRHLDAVTSAFEADLSRWLGGIALLMTASGLLVLAYALRPLNKLGDAVSAVRSGDTERLDGAWPTEIAPLVEDLNQLLDERDARIRDARLSAGNLAHGLRTSLAILTDESERLASLDERAAGVLLGQSHRMQRQLDWHLARARASTTGGLTPGRTDLPDALLPILSAMERLHATIRFTRAGAPASISIDPEDFAELVSNLIDNAGRWARSAVAVDWAPAGRMIEIRVTDDGPGIPEDRRAAVLGAGIRLDESRPGTGLGLAIAKDLATAAGGTLALSSRADGRSGLLAKVRLPLRD